MVYGHKACYNRVPPRVGAYHASSFAYRRSTGSRALQDAEPPASRWALRAVSEGRCSDRSAFRGDRCNMIANQARPSFHEEGAPEEPSL